MMKGLLKRFHGVMTSAMQAEMTPPRWKVILDGQALARS